MATVPIVAEVLAISYPACPRCSGTGGPCTLCDQLPAEVTVRPHGSPVTYLYLANADAIEIVTEALAEARARVVIAGEEADTLVSTDDLAALARQDVTYRQEEGR